MTAIDAAITEPSRPAAPCVTRPRRSGTLVTFNQPVSYSAAWALQQKYHADRLAGRRTDTLMLLEHLPVYTAGRRTKPAHLKPEHASSGHPSVPFEPVSRGGSVTYHGPGQLVGYPILALSEHASGAKAYVHMLEEVLIRTLSLWDIHGYRVLKTPGIWIQHRDGEVKIASIGARIDGGITLHGFALNVINDLRPFSRIIPCGLNGCRMTSMTEIRQTAIPVPLVAEQLAEAFSWVFRLDWTIRGSSAITTAKKDAGATTLR
ncbi:MAG TPA: lipoyl(octanoyl) transferase LipB [Nitrospira sp.]|nr:lipoyl(octanoyl) transferase LipB [Nitrospira sp.]